MYCTVLHLIVLYCIVLYCVVFHCIVLHCIALSWSLSFIVKRDSSFLQIDVRISMKPMCYFKVMFDNYSKDPLNIDEI